MHLTKTNDDKVSVIFIPAIKTVNEDKFKFSPIIVTVGADIVEETLLEQIKPALALLKETAESVHKFETSLMPKPKKDEKSKSDGKITEKKVTKSKIKPEDNIDEKKVKEKDKQAPKKVSQESPKVTLLEDQEYCVSCGGAMKDSEGKSCHLCKGTGIKQEESITKISGTVIKEESSKQDPETVTEFDGNKNGSFEQSVDKVGVDAKTPAEEKPVEEKKTKEKPPDTKPENEKDPDDWFK